MENMQWLVTYTLISSNCAYKVRVIFFNHSVCFKETRYVYMVNVVIQCFSTLSIQSTLSFFYALSILTFTHIHTLKDALKSNLGFVSCPKTFADWWDRTANLLISRWPAPPRERGLTSSAFPHLFPETQTKHLSKCWVLLWNDHMISNKIMAWYYMKSGRHPFFFFARFSSSLNVLWCYMRKITWAMVQMKSDGSCLLIKCDSWQTLGVSCFGCNLKHVKGVFVLSRDP